MKMNGLGRSIRWSEELKSFIELNPNFLRPNCQNKDLESASMSVKKYIYIF